MKPARRTHPFCAAPSARESIPLQARQEKRESWAYTPLHLRGLYAAALKRKQDKESKAKMAKRHAIKAEDSSSSKDSISVNNLEKPIPHKNAHKFRVAKAVSKLKSTMKADKKKDNEEMDIGFLSAVKKMQIEDKYNMLDSNDDVLSLDEEEISITSADV
jgi:hypothetical protein